jgi:3-oxoacyl-[acyl-carrier protein] reductase
MEHSSVDPDALRGKTALITGSGRNIGRAIALRLAAAGANVVLNGHRDPHAIEAVADEARAVGVKAVALLADVADDHEVDRMVTEATDLFGSIDIAISNVGVRDTRPLLDITPELWRSVINTNLNAAFYLARSVLPGMKRNGWGRIIHIAGRTGFFPKAERAHVGTSKSGLHALAKSIALEFGPFGITANTIAPGVIDTERSNTTHPGYQAEFARRSEEMPVRRLGRPDDITGLCLYLTSDAASFMTGQLLHINGGEFLY